jgi:hypothetical protein
MPQNRTDSVHQWVDPDFREAEAALRRAAKKAQRRAQEAGLEPIVRLPDDNVLTDTKEGITEQQLDRLEQELGSAIEAMDENYGTIRIGRKKKADLLPAEQRAQLEKAVQENADTFWIRLQRAAQKDICHEGGFIHDQWHRYGKIARRDLVKVSAGLLTGLGIGGSSLLMGIVPVALWIFTALTNIGISAFCDEGSGTPDS